MVLISIPVGSPWLGEPAKRYRLDPQHSTYLVRVGSACHAVLGHGREVSHEVHEPWLLVGLIDDDALPVDSLAVGEQGMAGKGGSRSQGGGSEGTW